MAVNELEGLLDWSFSGLATILKFDHNTAT